MPKNSEGSISFGMGLLIGVVGGVVAGLLYTPKSGVEIRDDIRKAAGLPEKEPELVYTKMASINLINRVKFTLEKQLYRVNEAVKAAKMASAKRKEELESGYNY